jgi:hypothetical protein
MVLALLGQGTDGNQSCGFGDFGAAAEDTAAPFSLVDDASFHAPGDRHDLTRDVP